jgi:hypothetical protein
MSYRLRIRLAAEADVAEAAQWYNERQLGLGEKFVREVDQAIVRILKNPRISSHSSTPCPACTYKTVSLSDLFLTKG